MTQPNDASKKSPRSFQCRDQLWETFEQMARELECSIDYLINEAMKQYARQRSYGAGAGSRTPFPGSRDSGPTDVGRPVMQQPPQHMTPPPVMQPPPAAPMARSGGTAPMPSGPPQASRLPPPPPPPPSGGRAPLPPPPTGRHPGMTGGPPPPPPMTRPGGPPPIPRGPGGSMPPSMGSVTPPHNPGMGSMGGPPPLGGPMSHGGHSMGGHPLPPPPQQQPQMPPPMAQPPSLQSMNAGAYLGGLTAIYQGERTSVNKEKFIIGRGRQASDLTIKDPNVSRQHAMIEFQNGVFYMVDLGSTNGVEYHGQRVTRKAIAEGDVFRICDHEVLFTFR